MPFLQMPELEERLLLEENKNIDYGYKTKFKKMAGKPEA